MYRLTYTKRYAKKIQCYSFHFMDIFNVGRAYDAEYYYVQKSILSWYQWKPNIKQVEDDA